MSDNPTPATVRWVKDRLRIHYAWLAESRHMTSRSASRTTAELEAWFDGTGGRPSIVSELVADALVDGVAVPAQLRVGAS